MAEHASPRGEWRTRGGRTETGVAPEAYAEAFAPGLKKGIRPEDRFAPPGNGRPRAGGSSRVPALVHLPLAWFDRRARPRGLPRLQQDPHALINIAVGTDAGEDFKTEGWWVATPGSCATPIRGPLKSRFVYLYATDIDGVDLAQRHRDDVHRPGQVRGLGRGQLLAARPAGRHLRRDRHARFARLDDVPDRPRK